ncbi:MAG TPA: phosphoglycerate kinase [Candidatus Parcubacteria bacterium]|nr:phosphoglycerate kinase [Candidatus Parcubacteria bacterium]
MTLRTIKETNVKDKRVLVRGDFNVPLDGNGNIADDFRLRQSVPTIEYLIRNNAKVILMSHLGDPGGRVVESLRLTPVQARLENLLNLKIKKADDCLGRKVEKMVGGLKAGEVLLLENLRFHREEKENNPEFAKSLAGLADIYVNDAFGSCHRSHSSIVGVPEFLPSFAGFLLEKEIEALSKVLNNPEKPLVVIIGGAKVSTKAKVIKYFLEKADHLLIGGKVANAILTVKGICVGRPWPEEEAVKDIEKINLTATNFHLPIDALISPTKEGDLYIREDAPGRVRTDELILDIGPETIKMFSKIISLAKTIFWAGPLGFFEQPRFENGTKLIAEAITRNRQAFKITGGGDTVAALDKFNLKERFDHISTGGGAMLDFLSGKKLPGIEILKITANSKK